MSAGKGPMKKMAHVGPNMTPMVDVVMVILIFFMTWMSFVGAEWFLRTALPKQGAQSDTTARLCASLHSNVAPAGPLKPHEGLRPAPGLAGEPVIDGAAGGVESST